MVRRIATWTMQGLGSANSSRWSTTGSACTRPSTISRRTLTKPVTGYSGKRHQTQFTAGRTVTDCCLTKGVQSTMSPVRNVTYLSGLESPIALFFSCIQREKRASPHFNLGVGMPSLIELGSTLAAPSSVHVAHRFSSRINSRSQKPASLSESGITPIAMAPIPMTASANPHQLPTRTSSVTFRISGGSS
ncbi:hypothetical protein ACVJBD_001798 [Rhizobium mongolense]